MGSGFTATAAVGGAGAAFLFGLAAHAARRAGSRGAGAFALWSATAGVRLLADALGPWLPTPWDAVAGVVGHVTTWIAALVLLLFALRFTETPPRARRWPALPFVVAGAAATLAVLTNPLHGGYLRSAWADPVVVFGPVGWAMVVLGNASVLGMLGLLVAAMVREAGRRLPLALVVVGVAINLLATVLPLFAWSPFGFGQTDVVARAVGAGLISVALFGFGLLRLAPVGREAVLQRMDDGWLLLDAAGRIADLNPAAARLLGVVPRTAVGREARDVLRAVDGLDAVWRGEGDLRLDVRAAGGAGERRLDVHATALRTRRGREVGRALLLHDVTELRRAEAVALERTRAVAALEERERVSRELHDGLAQVLAFARFEAEAARGLVRRDPATAEARLDRLAEVALEAHGEARAFIAGSAAGSRVGWSAAIAEAVRRVGEEAGLEVGFRMDGGLEDAALAAPVAAHLVRIVQEALHNVRKHARARRVAVAVEADGAWLQVLIDDDGVGLGDARATAGAGFGLGFMHERAAAAGGTLEIGPGPAAGTRVAVRVPRLGGAIARDAARVPALVGAGRGA